MKQLPFYTTIVLVSLLLSGLFSNASAQFTVTQSSLQSLLNIDIHQKSVIIDDTIRIVPLIEQIGENQVWDLSEMERSNLSEESEGMLRLLSAFEGKPGSDDESFSDATLMAQREFLLSVEVSGFVVDFNAISYDYNILSGTGLTSLGNLQADAQTPDQPFVRSEISPGNQLYKFPLEYGQSWESEYLQTIEGNGMDDQFTVSVSSVVDGWGVIDTGEEIIDVLRITTTEMEDPMTENGVVITTVNARFIDENGIEVATLSASEDPIFGGFETSRMSGQLTLYSTTGAVSIDSEEERAAAILLHQNFPNPFNPSTQITYQLNNPEQVTLSIYSLTGQKVQTLVNAEMKQAGFHTISFNADNLASGTYIYRLQTGDQTLIRKMTLLK